MHEKIVEILIYVLNEVRKTNKPIGEIDFKALERKGYTQSEISTAISWLYERLKPERNVVERKVDLRAPSFRVLHPAERFVLSQEAHGYLIQLRELNILSDQELELVIERAMLSGYEQLTPPEIQSIVSSILFTSVESYDQRRGQIMLGSSDTIQ
ncbi:MAG: DUF494 family protein [Ignavibacteriales bacterium]|nr:DUF494 family protein [Ignavibacteriales bacterium]